MNTLGQIKTLFEIQALKGFSTQSVNHNQNNNTSFFEELLQKTLIDTDATELAPSFNANSLGAIFSMSNLPTAQFSRHLDSGSLAVHSKVPMNQEISSPIKTSESSIENIINKAADKYNLPAKLIKSIIKHESNFNPSVVSHAGASGLMQLMPGTARGLGVIDIFDPEQNVMGGSKYIRNMLDKYNGNIELALAAYNAGPGNVSKYDGIPPFKETQAYVKKVTNSFYS
ncbi:lytic transglycosylase domain-containing protein [Bacillus sp. FSL K6-3431]|uniref:lytic transglycosylase domain-containing protein n=1 Tax=Bacillus sp. FSL K6-3431 TaxID=2921500 RepID=UPI0030F6C471